MGWLSDLSTDDEHPRAWLLGLLIAGVGFALVTFTDVTHYVSVALFIGGLILPFALGVIADRAQAPRTPDEPADPRE